MYPLLSGIGTKYGQGTLAQSSNRIQIDHGDNLVEWITAHLLHVVTRTQATEFLAAECHEYDAARLWLTGQAAHQLEHDGDTTGIVISTGMYLAPLTGGVRVFTTAKVIVVGTDHQALAGPVRVGTRQNPDHVLECHRRAQGVNRLLPGL